MFSPALSSKATREVSLARGLYFQEETYPINKDHPIVHTLGHNSLVSIQRESYLTFSGTPLQHLIVCTVRILHTRWFLIHNPTLQ